jgi:hypothetical protein
MIGSFPRQSARQQLSRLGWLFASLAALAGCQHSAADDAKAGRYSFDFICQSEDFKGQLQVTLAGDNRPLRGFLTQTFAESAGSHRSVSPAATP